MKNIFQKPRLSNVKELLVENQLPTEDLSVNNMEHFFGCGEKENAKGVIGLEIHGEDGLLRSLAVSPIVRGLGCGSALVKKLETHASSIGINHLYLLTDTAEDYFERKGYTTIDRDKVSESIKHTREFSDLCPASAAVMRKNISS